VHVDRCCFCESPGGTGVIEVNMTKKNVPNVAGVESGLSKIGHDVVKSRLWTGVEKRDAVVCFERGRGNDSSVTKLARIKNIQGHETSDEQPNVELSTINYQPSNFRS